MNNSPEFGLNESNGFEEAIRHLEKPGIGGGITVINEGEGDSEKGKVGENCNIHSPSTMAKCMDSSL